jgi:hypothetical protein
LSAPHLNQLFEEAVQRCSELGARAAAGVTAAHDVVEQAQALATMGVEEAERLHREYTETIAAIVQAGQASGQEADAAAQAVHSVTPEALQAATAVKDMLVAVEGGASHLAAERSRAFHDLDASARQAETAFHELAAQVKAFDDHLEARLGEAKEQLTELQRLVRDASADVEKAHQSLYEALDHLGHTAHRVTADTAHGLEQLLAAASCMIDYSHNAVWDHNGLVAAVRHDYLDETMADPEPASTYLGAAFDEAREALGRLQEVDEPAHSAMQTAMEALLEEGQKAVAGLGEVARSLQHSAELVAG